MVITDDVDLSAAQGLLSRARRGDTRAFCLLTEPLHSRLLRQAAALSGDLSPRRISFPKPWSRRGKSLSRYNETCRFSTWLYAILLHRHQKSLRCARSRPVSAAVFGVSEEQECRDQQDNIPSPEPSPAEAAARSEALFQLKQCIELLPVKHRNIILLRFFEDASLADMAAVLGCSAGTVKSRLHHALDKLRKMKMNLPIRKGIHCYEMVSRSLRAPARKHLPAGERRAAGRRGRRSGKPSGCVRRVPEVLRRGASPDRAACQLGAELWALIEPSEAAQLRWSEAVRRAGVSREFSFAATILHALVAEPTVVRYQRGRFRRSEQAKAGMLRYELGLQQRQDALHRLAGLWAIGEQERLVGLCRGALVRRGRRPGARENEILTAKGVSRGRSEMKFFRDVNKSAMEFLRQQNTSPAKRDGVYEDLKTDPLVQFALKDAISNVFCPAAKLWNTGTGSAAMREALSLMGGYGITEDCPGFLTYKWMDTQLEATYEGPEAVQRRNLSVTMTNELFLAQFQQWIVEMRRTAEHRPGTGACSLATSMQLWLWGAQTICRFQPTPMAARCTRARARA